MPSIQPEPPVHPVQRSLSPWQLKAESYVLFLHLKSLPAGVYDDVHAGWGSKENGEFQGGLGAIMIVRYTDTPVGPYDELMLIPGNFTVPRPGEGFEKVKIPKKALRISRIYVSQRTTVYNGRLNWNIPKHLARFEFSAPLAKAGEKPPTELGVEVFSPDSRSGDKVKPFFACTLRPFRWPPAIPTNTAYIPMRLLGVQPPLPEPAGRLTAATFEAERAVPIDAYDISKKNEEALLAGTERWAGWDMESKAWARGCWVDVHNGDEVDVANGEGQWWPKGLKPWGVGVWIEGMDFKITESIEWKL